MSLKNIRKVQKKSVLAAVLLFLANLLFFLTIWLLSKYDRVYIEQIFYQLKASSEGVHRVIMNSAWVRVGLLGTAVTAAETLLYMLLSGKFAKRLSDNERYTDYCTTKMCGFFAKRALTIAIVIFAAASAVFASQLDVVEYVDTVSEESDFIEDHYADPEKVTLTFPDNKRNLIYIFLESMESTFADIGAGEPITADFIPELHKLADENINFSNTDGIGGAFSFTGTTWTAAAMVAQTSGVVVKVPINADAYGKDTTYIPGIMSIGEILSAEGYNQTLLLGSNAEFHGREPYFTEHGKYEILDTDALKADGRLPEDYTEWWGFEDAKLFEYAMEELTRLASLGKPFNLTMLTADTHFPDGYSCPLCPTVHEKQYSNVLACSSEQVYNFVQWIKEQPFYDNTTIIISGDHLTMDQEFMADIDESFPRTVYNCIINAPIVPKNEKNRAFATFDMFPTTLAALNVSIEGDRLGLGTNLFSDQKTLTEQYGFDLLDDELQKKSEYYNTCFLEMEPNEE